MGYPRGSGGGLSVLCVRRSSSLSWDCSWRQKKHEKKAAALTESSLLPASCSPPLVSSSCALCSALCGALLVERARMK